MNPLNRSIQLILVTWGRVSALVVTSMTVAPQIAFAMLYGTPILGPTAGDLELIRRNTVRMTVRMEDGYETFCSGVVISPLEIYSEGHCFREENRTYLKQGRVFVLFNPTIPFGPPIAVQVRRVRYKEDLNFDAALVLLRMPGPYSTSLPFAQGGCDPSAEAYSVGFGRDESGQHSDIVKLNMFRSVSDEERKNLVDAIEDDLPRFKLLKKSGYGSVCLGDSGGPVLCRSGGRLSIAGTNSAIAPNVSLPEEDSDVVKSCRNAPYLFMSPIEIDLPLIERWRSEILQEN